MINWSFDHLDKSYKLLKEIKIKTNDIQEHDYWAYATNVLETSLHWEPLSNKAFTFTFFTWNWFGIAHVYLHSPLVVAMWCKLRLHPDQRCFLLLLLLSWYLPFLSPWNLATLDIILDKVSNISLMCVHLHRNVFNVY